MSEDGRLLKHLRRGDRDALRRVYEKYIDELLAVAASLLSRIDAAEDCVHDVFVDFAGAAGSIRIRHNLKGYLLSCVANRARDQLRKRPRETNRALEDSDYPTTSGEPASRLIDCEESARLFAALAKLPYEQREVFVLHAQGDMKFREIAGLVGVSTATVQSRYRYGIEKLRGLLEKENENEVSR
ncbi:MAG TPA: RNA polymerase sigma factor [Sedimentisphaerales bacterium]|nr:RNA polymerase sigma factor [Sedimentisphaerales bacterium]